MNKLFLRVILILLILAFASMACINSGDGGTANKGGASASGAESTLSGPEATATYGAEQFHLQLTAIAQPAP